MAILIVGAGISGLTLAERYANINKEIIVIEKRNHIGGNCYDYKNQFNITVSKYGAHIFHTNFNDVWNYVNRFTEWENYTHRVVSQIDNNQVPIPVNIKTINDLFNINIKNEFEMDEWLKQNVINFKEITNSEEVSLSRVGPVLYEKLFKNYTFKQWEKWPNELEPSVMARIPVRKSFDDRYFTDIYQGLPKNGFTKLFLNMTKNPNIKILLNTPWEEYKNSNRNFEKIFFTGPIDSYFSESLGKLEYRSINFEFQDLEIDKFQDYSVVNYPGNEAFTRIIEFKHFLKESFGTGKTTIVREYPTWVGEPYYPVPTEKNRIIFEKYQKAAKENEKNNIYFVGRLGTYKYLNMDQAFKNALDIFYKLEEL